MKGKDKTSVVTKVRGHKELEMKHNNERRWF